VVHEYRLNGTRWGFAFEEVGLPHPTLAGRRGRDRPASPCGIRRRTPSERQAHRPARYRPSAHARALARLLHGRGSRAHDPAASSTVRVVTPTATLSLRHKQSGGAGPLPQAQNGHADGLVDMAGVGANQLPRRPASRVGGRLLSRRRRPRPDAPLRHDCDRPRAPGCRWARYPKRHASRARPHRGNRS
jgi:hypothetical protein